MEKERSLLSIVHYSTLIQCLTIHLLGVTKNGFYQSYLSIKCSLLQSRGRHSELKVQHCTDIYSVAFKDVKTHPGRTLACLQCRPQALSLDHLLHLQDRQRLPRDPPTQPAPEIDDQINSSDSTRLDYKDLGGSGERWRHEAREHGLRISDLFTYQWQQATQKTSSALAVTPQCVYLKRLASNLTM